MPRRGSGDGTEVGEQIRPPVGAESASNLAIGGRRTQFAIATVVVGSNLGVIEEGEQVSVDLAVSLAQ